jgi:hypothetical protein
LAEESIELSLSSASVSTDTDYGASTSLSAAAVEAGSRNDMGLMSQVSEKAYSSSSADGFYDCSTSVTLL